MRKSPRRHPIAILRSELNLFQKELAALVNRSPRTIQSIELLKAPLSIGLAEAISRQTGVHPKWLLNGDPAIPPYDVSGAPYKRSAYELAQANLQFGIVDKLQVVPLAKRFSKVLRDAAEAPDAELRLWKVSKALKALENNDSYDPSVPE